MTSMSMNFNTNSEKTRFIFKPNPLNPMGYQIFENKIGARGYEPVGDYIVLDQNEDKTFTERKLTSVVRAISGKKALDLSAETDMRLLFQVVPKKDIDDPMKIVFRTYSGNGVSHENAILEIKRGIFDA